MEHNLVSLSMADLSNILGAKVDFIEPNSELTRTMLAVGRSYGQMDHMPGSSQIAAFLIVLDAIRAALINAAGDSHARDTERLMTIIRLNKDVRGAALIELVPEPSLYNVLTQFNVQKGMLFWMNIPEPIVLWHPWSEFKPAGNAGVWRSGYTEFNQHVRKHILRKPKL